MLRGVALCGILLMNIARFGLVFYAYGDPTVLGGAKGWNLNMWVINNMFFEGTMRAMFSMLFGVGMVLMTMRMEERGGGIEVAGIFYRRTLWLILFGIIHAYLILWVGKILFVYGLSGLFIFPFRKTSPARLIAAVVILTLCGVALQGYQYSKNMGNFEKFQQAEKYAAADSIPENIKEGIKPFDLTFLNAVL